MKNGIDLGFTLLEMMVVIAIISILSAIAVPNVISWRNNAQVNSAARDLYSTLQLAKSTAVKRNMNCTIVFGESVSGTAYDFVVFLEDPAAANLKYDAGEEVLKTVDLSQYGKVAMDSSGAAFTDNEAGNPAVTFRPNGFPYDVNESLGGGEVVLKGAIDKKVKMSNAGSIEISTY